MCLLCWLHTLERGQNKTKKHVPMPTPGPCPLSLHVWYEQSLLARQSWSDQSAVAVSENNHQNHHLECKKISIGLISKHVRRNSTKKGGQRNKPAHLHTGTNTVGILSYLKDRDWPSAIRHNNSLITGTIINLNDSSY